MVRLFAKTRLAGGVVILAGLLLGSYFISQSSSAAPRTSAAPRPTQTVTILIEGMSCVSCVARVKRTLRAIPGVTSAEVNLIQRAARVRYVEKKVTPARLSAAINQLGYKAGAPKSERAR